MSASTGRKFQQRGIAGDEQLRPTGKCLAQHLGIIRIDFDSCEFRPLDLLKLNADLSDALKYPVIRAAHDRAW